MIFVTLSMLLTYLLCYAFVVQMLATIIEFYFLVCHWLHSGNL